jgi:imidazoleglycerol-phosphate dehydratase/histidinol-phosphatase
MSLKKILFIDRDGTLIVEPEDYQIDSLAKLQLLPDVIPALLRLQRHGFRFVMVTNQDGLGSETFPTEHFDVPQAKLMEILHSQGIHFDAVHVCPHTVADACDCRKPKIGMMLSYLQRDDWDRKHAYVIGDRETDLQLAENMGIQGILYTKQYGWPEIVSQLLENRIASVSRKTQETDIVVQVNLDKPDNIHVKTGIRPPP